MMVSIPSTAFCTAAINFALQLANPDCEPWTTNNPTQEQFLSSELAQIDPIHKEQQQQQGEILSNYLKGLVTNNENELNSWLATNGWPGMNLNIAPNGWAVASIFDLLVDWLVPGSVSNLYVDGKQYEGVKMSSTNNAGLQAYQVEEYPHPLFEIKTRQDDWSVFLVKADQAYEPLDLSAKAGQLLSYNRSQYMFNSLKFPKVEMELEIDVNWLKGMRVNTFSIDEIVKKVRLRVDDKGARAESVVAMATRSLEMNVYTMDSPFFVIFAHPTLPIPPFVAIAGPDKAWTLVSSSS